MRVRVSFRVNTRTGQVEQFLIEDTGTQIEPGHEAAHDRIAYEVGRVVERRPAPEQVVGGAGTDPAGQLTYRPDEVEPPAPERESHRE